MGWMGNLSRSLKGMVSKKKSFDPMKLTMDDIVIPHGVKMISRGQIREIAQDKLELYKTLNIQYKLKDDCGAKIWDSWALGAILRCYKEDITLGNIDESVFPKFSRIHKMTELDPYIYKLVIKYVKSVPRTLEKDILVEDMKWDSADVSYLFYFLYRKGKE